MPNEKKYYTPVIDDGEHLLQSRDNPNRYRGLSRDSENDNPGIPEWELLNEDELYERLKQEREPYEYQNYDDYYGEYSVERDTHPIEDAAADAIAKLIFALGEAAIKELVIPWFKNTGIPWIKHKASEIKNTIFRKKRVDATELSVVDQQALELKPDMEKIEEYFNSQMIDMDEEEAQKHIFKIIYYMFGMAREISILSNARIKQESESEHEYLQNKKEMQLLLSGIVTDKLNNLLSNDEFLIPIESSKQIYKLFDSGIRMNGEYIPIEPETTRKLIYKEQMIEWLINLVVLY